jgi:hypothetical protein
VAYKIAGYAKDGTPILAPKVKPTSFTSAEIRAAILDFRKKKEKR